LNLDGVGWLSNLLRGAGKLQHSQPAQGLDYRIGIALQDHDADSLHWEVEKHSEKLRAGIHSPGLCLFVSVVELFRTQTASTSPASPVGHFAVSIRLL
jgi:hypothetical protein